MSRTYIALTLGPIYKTLTNARATRELWGASYLFSYIMAQLLTKFKENGVTIISPYVPNTIPQNGAGLFPDRCYCIAPNEQALDTVLTVRKTVIEQLAKDIAKDIKVVENEVLVFLQQYLKVYVLEQEIDNANPLLQLNRVLDTLELQDTIVPVEKRNYIADLLNKVNKSFLTQAAFGHNRSFNTLIEIASQGLASIDKQKYDAIIKSTLNAQKDSQSNTAQDEANTIKELKQKENFKDDFRTYHKYICIVHADGDNVGSAICGLKNTEDISDFSQKLYDFGIDAVEAIKQYGGLAVYAGGDDLLFFAPVMNGRKSIFDLIKDIDKLFEKTVSSIETDLGRTPNPMQLSYGVSISYYKYPMREAIEKSKDLCFTDAKKTKNAIALQVLKHSGQYWDTTLQKGSDIHKSFSTMLSSQLDKGEQMLKSVLHKLDAGAAVFKEIGNDKNRIANYLKNSFDEDVHKTPEMKKYFEDIATLIHAVLNEKPNEPIQARLDKVYALLSTIHFLKRKDQE